MKNSSIASKLITLYRYAIRLLPVYVIHCISPLINRATDDNSPTQNKCTEYEIFMSYKLHLSTIVLGPLQMLEGSDYILKHYHHLKNICHWGSSQIPPCA